MKILQNLKMNQNKIDQLNQLKTINDWYLRLVY